VTSDALPPEPRDAATVVVVRDGERGLELFCVERHHRSGFLGGALVFPGGKVDPGDHDDAWAERTTELRGRTRRFSDDERTARAFAVAALREVLEEAAIVPIVGDGLSGGDVLALRAELGTPSAPASRPFVEVLRERRLVLDTARLEAVSRWITPTAEPRRFDTRFYLLAAPPGQEGAHDEHETTRSFWATPAELLERWERGEVVLAPPTSWTIALFRGAGGVSAAFDVARRQSLDPVEPCFVTTGGEMILTMPGDPLHPGPESALVDPAAPTRFVLENGRFVPRRA
jgi:8-oxo-dGTP pyrophosphatase MutT (NUDIX family)